MMTKLLWTSWHRVAKISTNMKSEELSLNIFAADLCDVAMGRAKPLHQDARETFSLTYPTTSGADSSATTSSPARRYNRQAEMFKIAK